jgi:hypothetical protein
MSWTPSESEIIDYLYGEMTPEDVIRFEEYLEQNLELKKEVSELRLTQGILPSLKDEEVILPAHFTGKKETEPRQQVSRIWLYPISIAASIAALLFIGYLTQFSVTYGEDGFRMAFNDNTQEKIEALSKEDIDALIESRINLASNKLDNRMAELQTSFASQLDQNKRITEIEIKRVAGLQSKSEIGDEQILAFTSQLKDENRKMMQTFYQVSAEEQQKYMSTILTDFNEYLRDQRQEDLRYIQANLRELKDDSDNKQEETDKILANIITTVNNQNSLGQ